MQKQKEVNYSLTACIKAVFILGASLVVLAGCASTEAPQPQPAQPQEQAKEKADAINPQARADYEAALNAMRNGEGEKAKALLASLSQAYPDLSGPYTNLGLIYFREGNVDEAEKAFLQAIQVNPNSAVSYNHLGIINRGKGKFQEAETFYIKALEINDEYAYAHLNLGILYDLYIGKLELALQHYQRFQELTPEKDEEVNKWIVDLQRRIKTGG
jgi:Flp pilus assembly protein TadD